MRVFSRVVVIGVLGAGALGIWAACGGDDSTPVGTGGSSGSGGSSGASGTSGTNATGGSGGSGGGAAGTSATGGNAGTMSGKDGGPDSTASCNPYDASGLDEASVAQGMALVQALGCPKCHQAQPADAGIFLSGKTTTIVPDASIFPKNLTPDPATGIGCWSDPQVVNAIMNGIDDQDAELCTMPKFAARLDGGSAQAQLIVSFLRSLPAVNNEIPESQKVCPPPASTDGGAAEAGDAGTE